MTIFINLKKIINTVGQLSINIKTLYIKNLIYQKLLNPKKKRKLIIFKQIFRQIELIKHDKTNQIIKKKA